MSDTTGVARRHLDDPATVAPVVDIVVPVYNEAHVLPRSIERLHAYLTDHFPFSWRITIADNASTDGTWFEAMRLARDLGHVRALHLDTKGRGYALRTAWRESDAEVVAYMDVDLSTDLDALLPLVAPLVSGHSDVAIGSRLAAGASVARRPKREFISRSYNAFLRCVFATRVRDAQCGFKAVRADVARALLPATSDTGWFFDTELLLLAEHNGLRIHEVPVDWVDDADSRVRVVSTAIGDLKGSLRMARTFLRGGGYVDLGASARHGVDDDFGRRLVSFAAIGAASTVVSLALFLWWRNPLGPVLANAAAVTATFFANTWLHARVTARQRRPNWPRAVAVYVGSILLTSLALLAVEAMGLGLGAELAALAITWTLATLARLAVLDKGAIA
jgi:glycosyltransferase involved in cell wall biosynthesis/putative flippase GtrA